MKDELSQYIEDHLQYPNPVLAELEAAYHSDDDQAGPPHIGQQTGAFLSWIIHLIAARKVLEFGTAVGYSTIYLAQALRKTGGRLTAIELDEELLRRTARNVRRAGLSGTVDLIHGDADRIIDRLEGPYDLILQDAAKGLYPAMLERCVDRIRPGGVLAADDALFRPMGVRQELARAIDEYNRRVFDHPRLISTILPIGDGLTISVKR
jgi:predicted O-methyltransferase YrrM